MFVQSKLIFCTRTLYFIATFVVYLYIIKDLLSLITWQFYSRDVGIYAELTTSFSLTGIINCNCGGFNEIKSAIPTYNNFYYKFFLRVIILDGN